MRFQIVSVPVFLPGTDVISVFFQQLDVGVDRSPLCCKIVFFFRIAVSSFVLSKCFSSVYSTRILAIASGSSFLSAMILSLHSEYQKARFLHSILWCMIVLIHHKLPQQIRTKFINIIARNSSLILHKNPHF